MGWMLIDIGNTNVKFGITKDETILNVGKGNFSSFLKGLRRLIKVHNIEQVMLCSVVPKNSRQVKDLLRKQRVRLYECGTNIYIPVVNKYKYPNQVGQDRLINVYAANNLYDNVRLVIDLGTAVTFDFISKRGEYTGGLIFPGVKISLDSLLKTCALLPEKVDFPVKKIDMKAKTTQESISSGVVFGYSFLIKGFTDYIKKKNKEPFEILLTGGGEDLLIFEITGNDYKPAPFLSLEGLNLLKNTIKVKK